METLVIISFVGLMAIIGGIYFKIQDRKAQKIEE
jgi:hypothetical protein